MSERDLLAAAKRGDENAFGRLVAPYRRELHAHAYRMEGDRIREITVFLAPEAFDRFGLAERVEAD
jgi:hypothetical protein